MGSLKNRLESLEARTGPQERLSEEEERRHYLAVARCRRNEALGRGGAWQAKDVIRFLSKQRRATTTEELRKRALDWRPAHDPNLIECELSRAVYYRESGTEDMECPGEWRESFEAGAELLRLYEAIPDEVIARGLLEFAKIAEEDEEASEEWRKHYEESYGITSELIEAACGPDLEEITEDERQRRLEEHTASVLFGEKGYRVNRLLHRLAGSK